MASEVPSGQRKIDAKLPMVGLLLGLLVGAVVAWVMLHGVIESESVLAGFFRQVGFLIPMYFGGSIGGIIQLWKQAKSGEIARFLRRLFGGALRLILLFVSLFLGAWFGERFYGSHDVGLGVSAVLVLPVWVWLICRSSRVQLSAPPPA
jgi:hypothetical protein